MRLEEDPSALGMTVLLHIPTNQYGIATLEDGTGLAPKLELLREVLATEGGEEKRGEGYGELAPEGIALARAMIEWKGNPGDQLFSEGTLAVTLTLTLTLALTWKERWRIIAS